MSKNSEIHFSKTNRNGTFRAFSLLLLLVLFLCLFHFRLTSTFEWKNSRFIDTKLKVNFKEGKVHARVPLSISDFLRSYDIAEKIKTNIFRFSHQCFISV